MTRKDIKTLRGEMTQSTFGGLLGVTSQAVYYWERGTYSPGGSALILLRMIKSDRKATLRILQKMAGLQ